jgi:hypothetical protein
MEEYMVHSQKESKLMDKVYGVVVPSVVTLLIIGVQWCPPRL